MIEINNESAIDVDETVLQRLTDFNLAQLHVSADAEVAIVLVDEGAMEALHVQWMDEPGPTDVLSFPMDELRPGTEDRPTPPGLLGDIVLCPQVAETQARGIVHVGLLSSGVLPVWNVTTIGQRTPRHREAGPGWDGCERCVSGSCRSRRCRRRSAGRRRSA